MKRIFCLFLILCLLPVFAYSEQIDLSGMTFEELVELREQINLAIWKSKEWQAVTVPQGVYEVGKDIPAGKWVITCKDGNRDSYLLGRCLIKWGSKKPIDEYFTGDTSKGRIEIWNPKSKDYKQNGVTEYVIELEVGDYVVIDSTYGKAVFKTYSGMIDLGFK